MSLSLLLLSSEARERLNIYVSERSTSHATIGSTSRATKDSRLVFSAPFGGPPRSSSTTDSTDNALTQERSPRPERGVSAVLFASRLKVSTGSALLWESTLSTYSVVGRAKREKMLRLSSTVVCRERLEEMSEKHSQVAYKREEQAPD